MEGQYFDGFKNCSDTDLSYIDGACKFSVRQNVKIFCSKRELNYDVQLQMLVRVAETAALV